MLRKDGLGPVLVNSTLAPLYITCLERVKSRQRAQNPMEQNFVFIHTLINLAFIDYSTSLCCSLLGLLRTSQPSPNLYGG